MVILDIATEFTVRINLFYQLVNINFLWTVFVVQKAFHVLKRLSYKFEFVCPTLKIA